MILAQFLSKIANFTRDFLKKPVLPGVFEGYKIDANITNYSRNHVVSDGNSSISAGGWPDCTH